MSRLARPEVVAFLDDVKDNPDDPAPRLILADWLADTGDEADEAMAEYIRLHWDAKQRRQYASDWEKGERRRSLFRQYKQAWFGPLVDLESEGSQPQYTVKAGLLDVRVNRDIWDRLGRLRAATLEAWHWIDTLELAGVVWPFAQVAMSPLLTGIRKLKLTHVEVGDRGACALAEAPLLRGLRELDLDWAGVRDKGALALAASPYLGGLKRLSLAGNPLGRDARQALRQRFGVALHLPA
jgi:uncharacterized protein (TIGR02996 family)